MEEKYKNALINIANLFEKKKKIFRPFIRKRIINALRISGLSRREVNELNFKVCKYLWSEAKLVKEPSKRGRKEIQVDLKIAIQEHLEKYSNVSSNRSIKFPIGNDEKTDIAVQHRNETLEIIYDNFPFKNEIKFSTFCKYIDKKFKKPHRLSDLCEYCEHGRNLKKKISNLLEVVGYAGIFECENILNYINSDFLEFTE
jgi:hypothetical protein